MKCFGAIVVGFRQLLRDTTANLSKMIHKSDMAVYSQMEGTAFVNAG